MPPAQQRVEAGKFTVAYLAAGRVVALDCINTPADFAQGKLLVQRRATVDAQLLADAAQPLKAWLPQPSRA